MIKRVTSFSTAFVLAISSLFVLVPSASAAAETKSWNGSLGNSSYSAAANWTGGTSRAPEGGDALVFDATVATDEDHRSVNFNSGMLYEYTGITFSGGTFSISGDPFSLGGNITVTNNGTAIIANNLALATGSHTINVGAGSILYLDGPIGGASGATITKTGGGTLVLSGASNFAGTVTVSSGTVEAVGVTALGSVSAGTTVADGASLLLDGGCDSGATIGEPLTLRGASTVPTGDLPTAKLTTNVGCSGGGGGYDESYGAGGNNSNVLNLTGTITADTTDVTVASYNKTVVSTAIAGGHNLNLVPGYIGQWVIGGETKTPAVFTKTLSDTQASSDVDIAAGAEITVTGTRGAVTVSGGTLKGTGTVGAVDMFAGTIAPGMSPGILNTGNLAFTGGTHQVELGGTGSGQFDQLNVTGTVSLGTATTLTTSLVNGFKPAGNDSFVIINNDGTDAVTGTFSGLAEGATFTLDGTVFKISYVGGSGNDVVLTAQAVPTTPNTGLGLILSNPATIAATVIAAAAGALLLTRRYRQLTARR